MATTVAIKKTSFEGKTVKPNDKVKIIYTDNKHFHVPGEVSEVHPVQAEKLIQKNAAVKWTADLEKQYAEKSASTEKKIPANNGGTLEL